MLGAVAVAVGHSADNLDPSHTAVVVASVPGPLAAADTGETAGDGQPGVAVGVQVVVCKVGSRAVAG